MSTPETAAPNTLGEALVWLIIFLGTSGTLGMGGKAIWTHWTGSAKRKHDALRDTADQLEVELARRRRWQEYSAILRIALLQRGARPDEIPGPPIE